MKRYPRHSPAKTSAGSAAAFRAMYAKRISSPNYILIQNTTRYAACFREVTLEHLSSRFPKRVGQVHREIADDWGRVCIRSVERALTRLMKDGQVLRDERGYRRAA